jgi:hypothetical protein
MCRRIRSRWAAGLSAAVLAACVLVVGPAVPANAISVSVGVNLRPCVDLTNPACAPVGVTTSTGVVKMRCYRDGSWATGAYRSPRWFLVYLSDGREGYVHSSFVTGQVPTPNCTTLAYVRAADKVLSYLGQVYAASDVANYYGAASWAPGPFAEWSGDCAKLSGSAYILGAGLSFPRGNAIDQFRSLRGQGRIYPGIPRYGAPVFYDIAAPYGHTAVYVGGLTIVTTQGYDHNALPVVRKGLYDYGNYLGWAAIG